MADRVRFGVAGTGYWARVVHAAGVASHPDTELAGVWGRDPAKAAAVAAEFGTVPFADFDAMLDAVDAVSFSVPPQVQAELAPRAAAAGRHLLLEKPLAIGTAAADRVVRAVEHAGVASVVFFTDRYVPEREAWLQALRAEGGCLGGEAVWLASLDTPGNPFAGSPWRRAEGALWDIGPHALSALLPVLGPVLGTVGGVVGARGPGDLVTLVFSHESGASSTARLSLTMPPAATRSGLEFYRADGWHTRPAGSFRTIDAYRVAAGELVALARSGATGHRCDARFGRDVVAVLERAQRAVDG
jgi:predicted dehydrogenase